MTNRNDNPRELFDIDRQQSGLPDPKLMRKMGPDELSAYIDTGIVPKKRRSTLTGEYIETLKQVYQNEGLIDTLIYEISSTFYSLINRIYSVRKYSKERGMRKDLLRYHSPEYKTAHLGF